MPTESVARENAGPARLVIVGAGGHAKVVMDAVLACGHDPGGLCFADDDPHRAGSQMLGCRVEGPVTAWVAKDGRFHVAIGDNQVRRRLQQQLLASGAVAHAIVHPRATVSFTSVLGDGAFVAAAAVVAPAARVGAGVIVNHAAVVDHDCLVGEFAHVAPHVTLGGGVSVGALAMIGAGATVLPGLTIGERAVIGAGAVVVKPVAAGAIVRGVPACEKKRT